jgi:hypothetical protein
VALNLLAEVHGSKLNYGVIARRCLLEKTIEFDGAEWRGLFVAVRRKMELLALANMIWRVVKTSVFLALDLCLAGKRAERGTRLQRELFANYFYMFDGVCIFRRALSETHLSFSSAHISSSVQIT